MEQSPWEANSHSAN